MSESVESSVAQVGIRDFLFYVLPGFVLLIGIFAWAGISLKDVQASGDISSSVVAILLSYCLGQFIYAYSYPIRWLLEKIRPFKLEKDDSENFQKMYLKATENHGSYFEVEVFRYRTFARFCSLMIIRSTA